MSLYPCIIQEDTICRTRTANVPAMDGNTAIRRSRRANHLVPIFAMTPNTFVGNKRSCREAGMNGYLAKPVSVKNSADALAILDTPEAQNH